MIRKQGFFLLSLLGKKTDGVRHGEERQTDGLDDASTHFVQQRFCGLKEGNLNIFFALWIGERRRLRQRRHLPEKNKWRIRERKRERDSGQNQQCWVDKSLVLAIFHYHSSNISLFFYFLKFASVKLLWYESRNHTYRHSTWIHCCCSNKRWNLTLTIFSNQLTCK